MLTTGEVAKLFHVSAQTVINWLDQGRIPFERIGKGPRRVTEINLLKYIQDIGISTEALNQPIYSKIKQKTVDNGALLGEAILIVNSESRIISCSEAMSIIVERSNSELVGIDANLLILTENLMDLRLTLEKSTSDHPMDIKLKVKTASGVEKTLDAVVSRFYKASSMNAGFVIYFILDSSIN